MDWPLVSIITPIYNVEPYIERCLRSIFEQTYDNLEYIFVDDATPDRSIDVIKRVLADYPRRKKQVHIIHHNWNKGIAAARNAAVKTCTGEFVFHVDPDDWIEIDAVEILVKKQKETNADIISGQAIDHKLGRQTPHKDGGEHLDRTDLLTNVLKGNVSTSLWRRLIRKSLYTNYNITANESGSSGEDYQVLPRLIYYANSVSGIDTVIYHYNTDNNKSITNNFWTDVNFQLQNYESVSVITKFFSDKEPYLREIVNGQNIKRLYYFLMKNASERNRQGYKTICDKLLSLDKNEWYHIGWNKAIKRHIDTHYALRIILTPFLNRYYQCKTFAYNITKKYDKNINGSGQH